MDKLKVLELFAGSRSIGKVAESLGHTVFSVDIHPFEGIDYVGDILDFNATDIPFKPDVIWASPPCDTYSVAAISHHRPHNKHMSPAAEIGDKIVKKTLSLIKEINPKVWYIENPRGMLRKQIFMAGLPRATVWYCRYGETRAKPTDIWSNNIRNLLNPEGWQPRPECKNGNKNCHHQPAPRGSTNGTQGVKGKYARSIIPHELCLEVLRASL